MNIQTNQVPTQQQHATIFSSYVKYRFCLQPLKLNFEITRHNSLQELKGSRFPYILLLTQEVGCLLCCHDDITPCTCALHGASAQRMHIKYFIFVITKYSVLTLLLAINVMFAYRAVPPKVIRLRKRSSR